MSNTTDQPKTSYADAGKSSADTLGDYAHQPVDHPYTKLGGFLGFIVYGNYVAAALEIISALVSMAGISETITLLSSYGGSNGLSLLYLIPLMYIIYAGYSIWWATQIKNRNPSFLRNYHYVCAALIIALFLVELASHTSFATAFVSSCCYVIGVALYTTYFVKSVRVRTYFGSDEYLRLSPFTKNLQAPEPAVPDDGNAGTASAPKYTPGTSASNPDVVERGVEAITRGVSAASRSVSAVGRAAKGSQVMTQLELANKKAKLKNQLSDLEKSRHDATAQLGTSLYDVTKGIASLRAGREELYDAIGEIDKRREELKAELESLEMPPPAQPAATALKCPRCGADIRTGDMFCRGCGVSADEARAEAARERSESPQRSTPPFKCPRCGSYVRPGDLFCGACGTPVDKTRSESAKPSRPSSAPVSSPVIRCPRCGTVIKEGERFCRECGMAASDARTQVKRTKAAHMRQRVPNLD